MFATLHSFILITLEALRKYLHEDSLHTLVHSFITNRLDYSLLSGASKEQITKVQRAQNAAERLLKNVGKHSHITPILYELHWLPIQARIKFKIIILFTLKVHNLAPSVFGEPALNPDTFSSYYLSYG